MVICSRCKSNEAAIRIRYAKINLCIECFKKFYVNKLKRTIEEYHMINDGDIVAVAVSGGKDSAALLHALINAYPKLEVKAVHINLGIEGYSNQCQEKVEELAKQLDVELHIIDIKKEIGISIDDFKKTKFKGKMCSVCGTVKRHIMDEAAMNIGANTIATGHNMDDFMTFMIKNFITRQWNQLVKLKPVVPPVMSGMPKKIRPLIKFPAEENMLYCYYTKIPVNEVECPHSKGAKTLEVMKILNELFEDEPNMKYQVLGSFLNLISLLEKAIKEENVIPCRKCGFPSKDGLCSYCKRIELLKSILLK